MTPTVGDVAAWLARFAPLHLAAKWDNVGLLAGDPAAPAGVVMTCLTVTPDIAAEAVAGGVRLIVAHHPVLFRGAKALTPDTPDGRVLLPLLRHSVAVYSPHTAFDNCPGGINDGLCARLGLVNVQPLRPAPAARPDTAQVKLVAFVPATDADALADALFAAGAGTIGAYTECSFRTPGTGTFFGGDSANPRVGRKGRREEVEEVRLEVVVPVGRIDAVVAALRATHRYEEPAFDLVPLRSANIVPAGGEGRVGDLPAAETLADLARRVKDRLTANAVQISGDPTRRVTRVAVACGAGGEFLADAVERGTDVLLTGEIRYHDALAATAAGVALILPGHHATERPGVEDLADKLAVAFPTATVFASRCEVDPLAAV